MATYEDEINRLRPFLERLSNIALFGKKIVVHGAENFVKQGANIIVGNHIGTFKDIATIVKIVPRPIFFTANRLIFNKKDFNALISKHLRLHLKDFGLVVDLLFKPLKMHFVNYISTNVTKAGMIPVDLSRSRRLALDKCEEYLQQDRTIIALQGRGRVEKHASHPYVSPFRKGVSILVHNLFEREGLVVPVTPIAFFGTHIPFGVPARVRVNVSAPMRITDYLADDVSETIENFRAALESRVKTLFLELIRE